MKIRARKIHSRAAATGAAATEAAATGAATNGEPATGEVEGPPGDSVLIQLLEARRLLIELLDCELNPLVPLLMDGSMIHSTSLVSGSWLEPALCPSSWAKRFVCIA